MSKVQKLILILVVLVLGGSTFYVYQKTRPEKQTLQPAEVTYSSPSDIAAPPNSNQSSPLPPSLQIKVPFTPQAPTANWDELHNEGCEEASAIMAHAYFNNITSLPPELVEQEISKLTDWQNSEFGYHLSITTEEAGQMIKENYGLKPEVVGISETVIKEALLANKLVIIPANGQMLGNPYYKSPGPIYHMFVITGYNNKGFVTNDPGTKRGENYQYDYQTIAAATGNWDHVAHQVNLTDKKIIIVSK